MSLIRFDIRTIIAENYKIKCKCGENLLNLSKVSGPKYIWSNIHSSSSFSSRHLGVNIRNV